MRMDKRELKWDNMLAGIRVQPDYLRGGAAAALHTAATDLPLNTPSRVYLVGCGDSHYAGLATRFAFERWSGVPTEALESLEFSRYAVHSAPSRTPGEWSARSSARASPASVGSPRSG